MSDDLTALQRMTRKIKLELDGLVVLEPLTWDEWAAQATAFQAADRALPFFLGDLVNYGEDRWGDEIWQVIDRYVGQRTAKNYAWVCRRFPRGQRRSDLTMGHHAEVASICYTSPADAAALLELAADRNLTVLELRPLANAKRAALKAANEAAATLAPDTPAEDHPLAETAKANGCTPREMGERIETALAHGSLESVANPPKMVLCPACLGRGVVPREGATDGE